MDNTQQESFLQMHLDYDGGNILQETVRWSRFLAIVGFVGLAICLLVGVIAGRTLFAMVGNLAPGMQSLDGAVLMVILLAIFVSYVYAVIMLYRFSVLTRRGILTQDQQVFSQGIKCLKFYFLVSGLLAILSLLGNINSFVKILNA